MKVSDCVKIVHDRINVLDPQNSIKVAGYIFLNHSDQEIIDYAVGSNELLYSLILEAKAYLESEQKKSSPSGPMSPDQSYISFPTVSQSISVPSSFRVPAPYSIPTDLELMNYHEQKQLQADLMNNYYYESQLSGGLGSRTNLISPTAGFTEPPPTKACHYYYRGYCKHGSNCRYLHGQTIADGEPQVYSLSPNELVMDDHVFTPGSLRRLELEISAILRDKKGVPVSIASLPMLYLEKYGKALQAEGYLTESQRHGKAGFSLTKLLARLKGIRLMDKPHGQHSVVLAEEAPKYMEYRSDRTEPGALLASSHQIYLTFPAESTFTDEDVFNYFKQYGPVRDVRIPRQEKRMFGFVSFVYPETVRMILAKAHPHYICDSRVLVKPYKEKPRSCDRKPTNVIEISTSYHFQFEMEPEFHTNGGGHLVQNQLIENPEFALELQRRRLLGLQLASQGFDPYSYPSYGVEGSDIPSATDNFGAYHAFENTASNTDETARQAQDNSGDGDNDSDHIELPDSPFSTSHVGNTDIDTLL